jgi:hypothetical protein
MLQGDSPNLRIISNKDGTRSKKNLETLGVGGSRQKKFRLRALHYEIAVVLLNQITSQNQSDLFITFYNSA